jgi:hypothetical protein
MVHLLYLSNVTSHTAYLFMEVKREICGNYFEGGDNF